MTFYNFFGTGVPAGDACAYARVKIQNRLPDIDIYEYDRLYNEGRLENYAATEFLRMMAEIERLYFHTNMGETHTRTYLRYKDTMSLVYQRTDQSNAKETAGIFITETPRSYYDESNYPDAIHMTGAEHTIRTDGNHFLKIFTKGTDIKIIWVYSNKSLSLNQVIKLKMLEWALFKDGIENNVLPIDKLPNAILQQDWETANQCINDLLNLDILKKVKFEELKSVFKPNYKRAIEDAEMRKEDLECRFLDYQNKLSSTIIKIQEVNDKILFLENQKRSEPDNEDVINFVLKNPYIQDAYKESENSVNLMYEAPLLYFDEYAAEKVMPHYDVQEKKIIKAIVDAEYELVTRCKIRFYTDSFNIAVERIGSGSDIIGHPHIDRHGCTGNHEIAIHEAAKSCNYIGALEQISQAVLNINFLDSIVTRRLIELLLGSGRRRKTWRNKETGVFISTEELLEVLE